MFKISGIFFRKLLDVSAEIAFPHLPGLCRLIWFFFSKKNPSACDGSDRPKCVFIYTGRVSADVACKPWPQDLANLAMAELPGWACAEICLIRTSPD